MYLETIVQQMVILLDTFMTYESIFMSSYVRQREATLVGGKRFPEIQKPVCDQCQLWIYEFLLLYMLTFIVMHILVPSIYQWWRCLYILSCLILVEYILPQKIYKIQKIVESFAHFLSAVVCISRIFITSLYCYGFCKSLFISYNRFSFVHIYVIYQF